MVFLALPLLPSPGLCSAGSQSSPRRLGHCPLFQRIKLVLLLSLSLFQQFLPPLSLGSGKHSCLGAAKQNMHQRDTKGWGLAAPWWQGQLPWDGHLTLPLRWCLFCIP